MRAAGHSTLVLLFLLPAPDLAHDWGSFFSGEGVSEVEKESFIASASKTSVVSQKVLFVPAADVIWLELPHTGVWELNLS